MVLTEFQFPNRECYLPVGQKSYRKKPILKWASRRLKPKSFKQGLDIYLFELFLDEQSKCVGVRCCFPLMKKKGQNIFSTCRPCGAPHQSYVALKPRTSFFKLAHNITEVFLLFSSKAHQEKPLCILPPVFHMIRTYAFPADNILFWEVVFTEPEPLASSFKSYFLNRQLVACVSLLLTALHLLP